MNPTEAVALCRLAKAFCPQQAFDEYTPDAWHEALGDLRFIDCKDAMVALARKQVFIAPAEIRDAVKRLRDDRIDAYGPIEPPADLDPSDTRAYSEWFTNTRRAIGDGTLTPPPPIESVDGPPELAAAIGKLEAGWNVHDKRRRVAPVGSVLPAVTEPQAARATKDDA